MDLIGVLNKQEIRLLLSKSDLFIFLTYTEGFSISLLEAMAMGVPIITTDVGANYEMLENKGGFIVPIKSDISTINEKLDMIKDMKTREKMSNWNINKVLNHYTVDSVMKQLVNEYTKLLEND